MMSSSLPQGWEEKKLSDILTLKYGKDHKKLNSGNIPVYGSGGVMRYANEFLYDRESILIPRKGTLTNLFYVNEAFWTVDTIFWSKINDDIIHGKFIYYYLKNTNLSNLNEGSAVPSLTTKVLNEVKVFFPTDINEQKRIADILSAFDDKIELNNQMNQTLENMATALFKEWFENFNFPNDEGKAYKESGGEFKSSELGEIPVDWEVKKSNEFSNINIGKTPPRKEPQWFNTKKNDDNINWVSIKDMAENGIFNLNSSEFLTKESIDKFNVKVVPINTVILSFKLTVGRVKITSCNTTTNEAIAHFNIIDNKEISSEYLYCFLKSFNYDSLGSTSSIAKAVNSQTIKNMKILISDKLTMKRFTHIIKPIFEQIQQNQQQNQTLKKQRDTLLAKLMSGEIRV